MEDRTFEMLAQRMKAVADPTRLRIVKYLVDGDRCVGDIVRAVGGSQANVSKHLRVLRQAGFVAARKDKGRVYYALADESVVQVCDLMCGSLATLLKHREMSFARFSAGQSRREEMDTARRHGNHEIEGTLREEHER
jgi:ArsR family transcriptional regulator